MVWRELGPHLGPESSQHREPGQGTWAPRASLSSPQNGWDNPLPRGIWAAARAVTHAKAPSLGPDMQKALDEVESEQKWKLPPPSPYQARPEPPWDTVLSPAFPKEPWALRGRASGL